MVENKFDAAASTWDKERRRSELANSVSGFLLNNLPLKKDFSVLDYGCGTGLVGFGFTKTAGSICFIDTSDGMLGQVRKKAAGLNNVEIEAINFDVLSEKTLNKKFDLIVSAMTMHHIEDAFGAMEKLSGLLNPFGYLAVADICTEDGSFHGETKVFHKGFEPDEIVGVFEKIELDEIIAENVYTIDKESSVYPVFCVCGQALPAPDRVS